MSWLAKVRRYGDGGAESVLSKHETKVGAEQVVAAWNNRYHTDVAYVEKFEAAKMFWPTVSDEELDKLLEDLSRY